MRTTVGGYAGSGKIQRRAQTRWSCSTVPSRSLERSWAHSMRYLKTSTFLRSKQTGSQKSVSPNSESSARDHRVADDHSQVTTGARPGVSSAPGPPVRRCNPSHSPSTALSVRVSIQPPNATHNNSDAKTRHLRSITISEYSTIHTTTTEDARTDAQNGRPRAIYRYRTSHNDDDDDKSDAHEALYILRNTAEVAVGERARRAADDNGTTRRRRRRDREGSGRGVS